MTTTVEERQPIGNGQVPAGGLQEEARQTYRESAAAEMPLSGKKLGGLFGRSERWGRDRINEVKSEPDAAAERQPDGTATAYPAVRRHSGRGIAWVALLSGISVSVAGNVIHADKDPRAELPAMLIAAFWPLALFLSVEVITRVQWPVGRWYAVARFGGTGCVAVVAAVVSYRHMSELLALWGEDTLSAHLGPLAIDGLVVVAATALAVARNTKE